MMTYYLSEVIEPLSYSVMIGEKSRLATATDVSFISDDLILAASYFGREIYLIDLSNEQFNIIESIKTENFIDLIDYRDGLLVTSHLPYKKNPGSISILQVIDKKISLIKNINLPGTKPHGCTILSDEIVIVSDMGNEGLIFLDIKTEKKLKVFKDFEFYAKDVCISDDLIFVLTTKNKPRRSSATYDSTLLESEIILFRFFLPEMQLQKLDSYRFKGQTDSIAFYNGVGLVTIQDQNKVLRFKLEDSKIFPNGLIDGFDFPHGVSMCKEKVAISNYGDNSIRLLNN
jgi:hypothetical protein